VIQMKTSSVKLISTLTVFLSLPCAFAQTRPGTTAAGAAPYVSLGPTGAQTIKQPSASLPLDVNHSAAAISNHVVMADRFSGADGGAQIVSAIAALPATGGVVDARELTTDAHGTKGSVFITENLDFTSGGVAISKPVTILFGTATYIFSTSQKYQSNDFVLRGTGSSGGTVFEFTSALAGSDVFHIPTGVFRVAITNLLLKPQSRGTKPSAVIDSEGYYGVFSQLELDDPGNGIFVSNGEHTLIEHIYITTTTSGTLNYGVMLYGNDNDTFIDDLWGVSYYSITDAFLHIRNRASGIRISNLSWQSNGGGGVGVLLDCGSSPTVAPACTNRYGPSPTDRPEFVNFVNTFTEGYDLTDGIVIKGGRDIQFTSTYIASSVHAINISGESNEIVFDNTFMTAILDQCIIDSAQSASGVGYASVTITNSQIGSCSAAKNRTYAAIELAPGATDVNISNNRIGHSETSAASDSEYGVLLDGSNKNILIRGNDFTSQVNSEQYLNAPIAIVGPVSDTDVFADNIPVSNTYGYTMVLTNVPGLQILPDGLEVSRNLGLTNLKSPSQPAVGLGWNLTKGYEEMDFYNKAIGGWTAGFYKNTASGSTYTLEGIVDGSGNMFLNGSSIGLNGAEGGGPSWRSSSGAPSGPCVNGSLYTNTSGSASTTLFVCYAKTWHAATVQ
jgi:hypothetical protein